MQDIKSIQHSEEGKSEEDHELIQKKLAPRSSVLKKVKWELQWDPKMALCVLCSINVMLMAVIHHQGRVYQCFYVN